MKTRSILVAVCRLALKPLTAMAQPSRASGDNPEPPSVESVVAQASGDSHGDDFQRAGNPTRGPLGPIDLLRGYENGMTQISERVSAELSSISQAVRAGQIVREQAEYLTQERYQLAMMQYQVLSTLHDSLEHDVIQAAANSKRPAAADGSDTQVVIKPAMLESGQAH